MCCVKLTFTLTPIQYIPNRNIIGPIGAPINLLEQTVYVTPNSLALLKVPGPKFRKMKFL